MATPVGAQALADAAIANGLAALAANGHAAPALAPAPMTNGHTNGHDLATNGMTMNGLAPAANGLGVNGHAPATNGLAMNGHAPALAPVAANGHDVGANGVNGLNGHEPARKPLPIIAPRP